MANVWMPPSSYKLSEINGITPTLYAATSRPDALEAESSKLWESILRTIFDALEPRRAVEQYSQQPPSFDTGERLRRVDWGHFLVSTRFGLHIFLHCRASCRDGNVKFCYALTVHGTRAMLWKYTLATRILHPMLVQITRFKGYVSWADYFDAGDEVKSFAIVVGIAAAWRNPTVLHSLGPDDMKARLPLPRADQFLSYIPLKARVTLPPRYIPGSQALSTLPTDLIQPGRDASRKEWIAFLSKTPLTPEESHPFRTTRKRNVGALEEEDKDLDSASTTLAHTRASSGDSTAHVCICQPDPKIPRPRNAFILYRQHYQSVYPGLANPEISKIIGKQWQNQTPEVKNNWKALAEEEKLHHQQQYPTYRYQPKRNGRRNNLSSKALGSAGEKPKCAKCSGRSILTPSTPYSNVQSSVASPASVPRWRDAQGHFTAAACIQPGHASSSAASGPRDQASVDWALGATRHIVKSLWSTGGREGEDAVNFLNQALSRSPERDLWDAARHDHEDEREEGSGEGSSGDGGGRRTGVNDNRT